MSLNFLGTFSFFILTPSPDSEFILSVNHISFFEISSKLFYYVFNRITSPYLSKIKVTTYIKSKDCHIMRKYYHL